MFFIRLMYGCLVNHLQPLMKTSQPWLLVTTVLMPHVVSLLTARAAVLVGKSDADIPRKRVVGVSAVDALVVWGSWCVFLLMTIVTHFG